MCHQEDPQAGGCPAATSLGESESGDSWAYRTDISGPGYGERMNKINKESLDLRLFDLL